MGATKTALRALRSWRLGVYILCALAFTLSAPFAIASALENDVAREKLHQVIHLLKRQPTLQCFSSLIQYIQVCLIRKNAVTLPASDLAGDANLLQGLHRLINGWKRQASRRAHLRQGH